MVVSGLIPFDFGIILITAFLLALIASRTGQPTIIAYIVTGLLLGPVFLDVVEASAFIDLIGELGLPLLLFLVGLEMKFDAFRNIISRVAKIAGAQILLQQILAFAVAYALGFGLMQAFVLSLCTIFGATPVVVKMLTDKKEASSLSGRIDIGTLILQDIYLVVVLAFLAAGEISSIGDVGLTLGRIIVLSILIGGASFLGSKLFEENVLGDLSNNKHAFFIQGIAWAFFFIALADILGLSMEIGGFLAGISLGQLPYSTELQEKVRPLTNFFIVIFFAGIGLTLNAEELFIHWKEALIAIAVLSSTAFIVMFKLIQWQGFSTEACFKGSINLVMVSEFSLVAGALAFEQGLITAGMLGYLTLMKLITNGFAVYLIQYNDSIYRKVRPYLPETGEKEEEIAELENHAVILGNSRLDEVVRPVINEKYQDLVFVEADPHEMRILESEGEQFVFGDPRHPEIREKSKMEDASVVISLEEDFELDRFLAEELQTDFIAVSDNVSEAEQLRKLGAHHVIIEDDAVEKILEKRLMEVLK